MLPVMGHIQAVKLLLVRDASRDAGNHKGQDSLALAISQEHKKIIQLLKEYKQNP